jgi:tol-pal system protein YbgF
VPLLALSGVAGAQSSGDISNRLSRIENELQTMSRAVYKGETPSVPGMGTVSGGGTDAADSLVRIQELETQIQTLTGKIEEQGFTVDQLKNKIDRMSADYELRLKDLETRLGGAGGSIGGAAAVGGVSPYGAGADTLNTPATTSGTASFNTLNTAPGPSGDIPQPQAQTGSGYQFSTNNVISSGDTAVQEQVPAASVNPLGTISESGSGGGGLAASGDAVAASYENAFSLLKAGNYDAAEKAFDDFLQKNPDHVLAGNAKYWLGETFYARANYEKAARVFAEAYQKYPDGSKAADNLLKLGLSLSATGNNTDACVAFRQLEKNYQSGAGPVLRRAQQEMSKLGC